MKYYKNMTVQRLLELLIICIANIPVLVSAAPLVDAEPTVTPTSYQIQPGDVLTVAVWREPDLQLEVLVRPDGGFSVPLIGEVDANGKTIPELRQELLDGYGKLIPDTDVSVSIKQLNGNKVYVIGKVGRPGAFMMLRPMDVMQMLSMAGGVTPFAAVDDIKILRRNGTIQQVFGFQYSSVESGHELEQNIMLKSGDVIVVP